MAKIIQTMPPVANINEENANFYVDTDKRISIVDLKNNFLGQFKQYLSFSSSVVDLPIPTTVGFLPLSSLIAVDNEWLNLTGDVFTIKKAGRIEFKLKANLNANTGNLDMTITNSAGTEYTPRRRQFTSKDSTIEYNFYRDMAVNDTIKIKWLGSSSGMTLPFLAANANFGIQPPFGVIINFKETAILQPPAQQSYKSTDPKSPKTNLSPIQHAVGEETMYQQSPTTQLLPTDLVEVGLADKEYIITAQNLAQNLAQMPLRQGTIEFFERFKQLKEYRAIDANERLELLNLGLVPLDGFSLLKANYDTQGQHIPAWLKQSDDGTTIVMKDLAPNNNHFLRSVKSNVYANVTQNDDMTLPQHQHTIDDNGTSDDEGVLGSVRASVASGDVPAKFHGQSGDFTVSGNNSTNSGYQGSSSDSGITDTLTNNDRPRTLGGRTANTTDTAIFGGSDSLSGMSGIITSQSIYVTWWLYVGIVNTPYTSAQLESMDAENAKRDLATKIAFEKEQKERFEKIDRPYQEHRKKQLAIIAERRKSVQDGMKKAKK